MFVYFSIYKESFAQVKNVVDKLKSVGYNDINARFDGHYDGKISNYLQQQGIKHYYTSNIKQRLGGGNNTQHYLRNYLNTSSGTYLMKIDPDTLPLSKLHRLPTASVGCNYKNSRYCVYGGCIIFPRNIARYIYESNLLLDDKYKSHRWSYFCRRLNKCVPSNDMVIYDVLKRLQINIDNMQDQIHCIGTPDNFNYCFIHEQNF